MEKHSPGPIEGFTMLGVAWFQGKQWSPLMRQTRHLTVENTLAAIAERAHDACKMEL